MMAPKVFSLCHGLLDARFHDIDGSLEDDNGLVSAQCLEPAGSHKIHEGLYKSRHYPLTIKSI